VSFPTVKTNGVLPVGLGPGILWVNPELAQETFGGSLYPVEVVVQRRG
jgi:hypothetical protein